MALKRGQKLIVLFSCLNIMTIDTIMAANNNNNNNKKSTPISVFSFFHQRYFNAMPHDHIEWSVIYPSVYMDRDYVEREIEMAFNVWSSTANINFVKRNRDIKSKILIGFYTENQHQMIKNDDFCDFNGNAVIAHAYFPPIHEIHIRDNPNYFQIQRGRHGPSLFNTMVHEIGHILSLRHSNSSKSIMFWSADLDRSNHQIGTNPLISEDRQRITNIYGWRRSKIEITV